jgi:glucose/arabinose dehydrogenase
VAHPGGDLPGNPAIQLVQVAKGLVDPINIASAPDGSGRLFVVERIGRIRIVDPDGTLLPTPFLDISRTVKSDYLEQGLLGLAFDPNYETNGYFYVNYTDWRTNGDTFIVRFKTSADDPNAADLNSARVLLTYDQPHVNHNGGTMKFGPDGYLYIAVGDGGLAGDPYDNAQNRSVLLGKILRIDVNVPDQMAAGETGTTSAASGASGTGSGASTAGAASEGVPPAFPGAAYRIAAANAGIGQVQYSPVASQMAQNGGYHPAARAEIFAYGLRNPWQFAFDPQTNDMFIADAGQNQWEEIDFVPAGMTETLNFGWSRMEGAHCYPHGVPCSPTGVLPVAEYPHTDGCSITGIGVHRGGASANLDGVYFAATIARATSGVWRWVRTARGSSSSS